MSLPIEWVEKIFNRMQGIYGYGFTSKYATGLHEGIDSGIENAKQVWADELANFRNWPEAIRYALEHLPDKAPNAVEFRDICRRAPKEQKPALEYKPTPEDQERAKKASREALEATKKEKDTLAWVRLPKSQGAHSLAFEAAKTDFRLKRIILELVEQGVTTKEGKLLKKWDGYQWIKA